MLTRYIHARGVLPSCSLCTNELSINENGKHLFCEHKRFSWINYCTTATKWKQKVQHRSCVAHFPLTNCYQSLANGTAQHGAGGRNQRAEAIKTSCELQFSAAIYSLWCLHSRSQTCWIIKRESCHRDGKRLTEAWWQYFPALHHFDEIKTKTRELPCFALFGWHL